MFYPGSLLSLFIPTPTPSQFRQIRVATSYGLKTKRRTGFCPWLFPVHFTMPLLGPQGKQTSGVLPVLLDVQTAILWDYSLKIRPPLSCVEPGEDVITWILNDTWTPKSRIEVCFAFFCFISGWVYLRWVLVEFCFVCFFFFCFFVSFSRSFGWKFSGRLCCSLLNFRMWSNNSHTSARCCKQVGIIVCWYLWYHLLSEDAGCTGGYKRLWFITKLLHPASYSILVFIASLFMMCPSQVPSVARTLMVVMLLAMWTCPPSFDCNVPRDSCYPTLAGWVPASLEAWD